MAAHHSGVVLNVVWTCVGKPVDLAWGGRVFWSGCLGCVWWDPCAPAVVCACGLLEFPSSMESDVDLVFLFTVLQPVPFIKRLVLDLAVGHLFALVENLARDLIGH